MNNVAEILRQLTKNKEEHYAVIGKVDAVNGDLCDVSPVNGDAKLFDVKLISATGDGVLITPAVGSIVIVDFINKNMAFVTMFSEVDKIEMKINEGFTFKTANESLKKILTDLLEGVEKMTFSNGAGVTGTPINMAIFTNIKTRLDNLFIE